jgi:hypothetical protein
MSRRAEAARPARGFTLTTAWAAVVIALLTLVFFHEVSLQGSTFVSPDATAPAGFVRIGEQSLWRDHVYPLWNPFVFLGMPSFGSGAYNPLIYPPDWPVALLQKFLPLPELTWLLLYYFLAGLFTYLLAREWGARPEGALIAAAAFVFQPNLVAVGSHGHGSQLVDSAYLPLMLWLSSRWLRNGTLAELGWLGLAGGFQLLRGHVQICFYTWLAIGLHAAVVLAFQARQFPDFTRSALRALALGGAALLAFGVAGVYNLPLRDYAQHSIRGASAAGGVAFGYATSWSMGFHELPSIVFPNFVGYGGATYWGAMPFTDYPNAFLGIAVVLLALFGFLPPAGAAAGPAPGPSATLRVFAGALAGLALLVSLGRHFPLYGLLFDHLPLFNKFRIPVMILILFQLGMALAAAWGWGALMQPPRDKSRPDLQDRVLGGAVVALALLGLLSLFGSDALRGPYVTAALGHQPRLGADAARAAFAAFAGDLGKVAFLGLALMALAWVARRGRMPVALASVVALVLLLVELWPVSRAVMQPTIGEPVARNLEAGRDDVVEFLEKAGPAGSFRVYCPEADRFQDNRLAGFAIATLGGYHAAKPRLFQDLMDSNALAQLPWLALLNARYWVFSRPVAPTDIPPDWYPLLRQRFAGQGGVVYEYALALPRATVVGAWQVVPDTGRAVLDSISVAARDPAGFTWLTSDPGLPSGPPAAAGRAEITKYRLHEVEVEVDATRPAVLRLADLWYPDWKVTVDGRPAKLLRADHLLRAVAVPEGRHKVVFRFESRAFTAGFWVSIASIVAAAALLAAGWWLGRRHAAIPAEAAPEGATP